MDLAIKIPVFHGSTGRLEWGFSSGSTRLLTPAGGKGMLPIRPGGIIPGPPIIPGIMPGKPSIPVVSEISDGSAQKLAVGGGKRPKFIFQGRRLKGDDSFTAARLRCKIRSSNVD